MPTPICFGFVGYSESGKTTLATAVTAELSRRGFKVAVLKDAHHQVDMDTPGKDTWRYRENGATQVILRTPERWVLQTSTPTTPTWITPTLSSLRGLKMKETSLKLR